MAATVPVPGDRLSDFKTIFDPATLTRKGLCPVTQLRGTDSATESHSLYFEQHGKGPIKILFIMGLNNTSFAWLPQVRHFGRQEQYSVLVFDNRGVGNSDAPRGPYSTSVMAEDTIVLLDYVGWTAPRDLHVVGVSMGGMISQELALRIPERIASLSLLVTTAGGRPFGNTPPWKGLTSLTRLMTMDAKKNPDQVIPIVLEMVYPVKWLDSKTPDGETNREKQTKSYKDRIGASRPQTLMGYTSQMFAGLSHYVSPARLARIGETIPKITIATGDEDNLVAPSNSEWLAKNIPQAEFQKWEETGHGIHAQWPERMNALITRTIEEGNTRVVNGWQPK